MADLGIMLQFNFLKFYSSRDPNVRIGLSVQNLGLSFTGFGNDIKTDDPLPTTIGAGISVKFIKPITVSADFIQPINLVTPGTYLFPYFNTGVSVQFTSFRFHILDISYNHLLYKVYHKYKKKTILK